MAGRTSVAYGGLSTAAAGAPEKIAASGKHVHGIRIATAIHHSRTLLQIVSDAEKGKHEKTHRDDDVCGLGRVQRVETRGTKSAACDREQSHGEQARYGTRNRPRPRQYGRERPRPRS